MFFHISGEMTELSMAPPARQLERGPGPQDCGAEEALCSPSLRGSALRIAIGCSN